MAHDIVKRFHPILSTKKSRDQVPLFTHVFLNSTSQCVLSISNKSMSFGLPISLTSVCSE